MSTTDFDRLGGVVVENPLDAKAKDLGSSSLYPVEEEQWENVNQESWKQDLRYVLSRAAPLHEAILSEEAELTSAQFKQKGSVRGNAPNDKLESFAYLPEMLAALRGHVVDFLVCGAPSSSNSPSYLLYMYIQIIVRELQVILNVTLLDPAFAKSLDTHLVNDFLKLWYEMVFIISELGENVQEAFESVIVPLIDTSQHLIAHWTLKEAPVLCGQTVKQIFASASGSDSEFTTADDRERALIFTGLCLFHIATLAVLPFSVASLTSLTNSLAAVFVSSVLLGYFVGKKQLGVCYATLLLSSLTPLLYYPGLEDRVPWGILFIPAWLLTALGTANRRLVLMSIVLFILSFAGRAVLINTVSNSNLWPSDAYGAVTVLLCSIGLLMHTIATDPLFDAYVCKTDAALYRHIAIQTLRAVKEGRPFSDTVSSLMAQLHSEDVNNITDGDIAQLGSLVTVIKHVSRVHARVNGREPKKRTPSSASECSALRLSKMTSGIGLRDMNNTVASRDNRFPFGELTFPDPFDEDCEMLMRIDNRVIHPYIGIIIVNADGEILLWNHKMTELTGITADQALANEIISFVIDAEQVTLLQMMEDALANQVPLTESVLIPFIRGDNVNRMYLEVSVASVVAEHEYLALFATPPNEEAMQQSEFAKWLFEQFIPSTEVIFNKISQLNHGHKALKQQAADCMKRIQNVHNLAMRINNEEACLCYLHIKTMLNKMLADFQKIAVKRKITVSLLPFAPDVPNVVHTQPVKLACAVGYLMSNAMKFSRDGGEITMSLTVTKDKPDDVGTINLNIADKGIGIPPEQLKSIFDPSARGEHSKLGLPTAASHINEIGGYIDASSTPGEGSTFTIKLPYLFRDEGGADVAEPTADDLLTKPEVPKVSLKVRCLLLEANSIYRTAFCHQFWERGYSLVTSPSIQPHLDPKEFDLIVVGISSIESAADFLEQLKNSPAEVILASKLFTDYHRNMIEEAGWFGLKLPLRRSAMKETLDIVEARIVENQKKAEEIDKIRRAFEGNASCPWERGKQIGQGSFGRVYQATNKLTGGKMACKIIPLPTDNDELMSILREVTVMAGLSHPNIIHYFYCERGYARDTKHQHSDDELYIFMELADGCLTSKIPPKGLLAAQASVYMRDILRGLQYLHSKNIVHRDVKVANVLIHGNCCKLTDFGTAVSLTTKKVGGECSNDMMNTMAGTPHYMAPEILNDHGHDWKADIWSIGCLLMEMVTNKPPWSHTGEGSWAAVKYICSITSDNMVWRVCVGVFTKIDFGPYDYHEYVLEFLRACLHLDPNQRLDTPHLLELPFLTEMNDDLARKTSVCTLATEVKATVVYVVRCSYTLHRRKGTKAVSPGKCISYTDHEDSDEMVWVVIVITLQAVAQLGGCNREVRAATWAEEDPQNTKNSQSIRPSVRG